MRSGAYFGQKFCARLGEWIVWSASQIGPTSYESIHQQPDDFLGSKAALILNWLKNALFESINVAIMESIRDELA